MKKKILMLMFIISALCACGNSSDKTESSASQEKATSSSEETAVSSDGSTAQDGTSSGLTEDDPEIQKIEATELLDLPELSEMGNITLPELSELEITKPEVTELTEDLIDQQIETLLKKFKTETDDAAKLGDTVNIDFEGSIDGVLFDGGKGEDYDLELGSGSFIDNFEEQLVGSKKGDVVTVHVTFPEDYQAENLQGKKADFKVTVNKVMTEPELTVDWLKENASEIGTEAETLEEFRKEQEVLLKAQLDYQYETNLNQQMIEALVDNSEIEVSDKMKEYAESYVITTELQQLGAYNVTLSYMLNMYGMSADDFLSQMQDAADDYAKQRMVISKIADDQGIKVTEQDMEDLSKKLSGLAGKTLSVDELTDIYGREELENEALTDKVFSYVADKVKTVE